jgi:hypothetical protein
MLAFNSHILALEATGAGVHNPSAHINTNSKVLNETKPDMHLPLHAE